MLQRLLCSALRIDPRKEELGIPFLFISPNFVTRSSVGGLVDLGGCILSLAG
jgi:hypothetical protein